MMLPSWITYEAIVNEENFLYFIIIYWKQTTNVCAFSVFRAIIEITRDNSCTAVAHSCCCDLFFSYVHAWKVSIISFDWAPSAMNG